MAKASRNACTPDVARALAKIWYESDVRAILPAVQVPTTILTMGARRRPRSSTLRRVADPGCRAARDTGRLVDAGDHTVLRGGDPPRRGGSATGSGSGPGARSRAVHRHRRIDRAAQRGGRRRVAFDPRPSRRACSRGDRTSPRPLRGFHGRRTLGDLRRSRPCGPMCPGDRRIGPRPRDTDPGGRAYGRSGTRRRRCPWHRRAHRSQGCRARRAHPKSSSPRP